MNQPTAVVVGLCAHGLAIARALSRNGIHVVALEVNRKLPGVRTLAAEVVFVEDINGLGLVDTLSSLAERMANPAVLLLTNDTMVETIARSYDALRDLYLISWGDCRMRILPLLRKEGIRQRCEAVRMLHPKSVLIRSRDELTAEIHTLRFPLILKPDRPVSAYKTLVVKDVEQLLKHSRLIERSLPSIAQEFVPGGDEMIHFAALYLDRGEVVARYEGRKLRSRPMGHTTIAIGEANDRTHELARRFFYGLEVSGPVSLELKRDSDGRHWVIEPTVGRTDFWVGLCVADGIDLPLIEYLTASGASVNSRIQRDRMLWLNEERDPGALPWVMLHHPSILLRRRWTWTYANARDRAPLYTWASSYLKHIPGRVFGKLLKSFRARQPAENA